MVSAEAKRLRLLVNLFCENMKGAKDLTALTTAYSTALASLYSLEFVFEENVTRYVDMVRLQYDSLVDKLIISYSDLFSDSTG